MKTTSLLFIFTLCSSFIIAQEKIVSGKILDKKTKQPLEYANIALEGTAIETIANSDGYFKLRIPHNGITFLK